jgi:hypothetical protein
MATASDGRLKSVTDAANRVSSLRMAASSARGERVVWAVRAAAQSARHAVRKMRWGMGEVEVEVEVGD